MRKKHRLAVLLNNYGFRRFGFELVDCKHIPPWVALDYDFLFDNIANDPGLNTHNPLYRDLKARYEAYDPVVTTPLIWKENVTTQIDPHGFRGSRAYIAQTRSTNNPIAYVATYYYTRQIDRLQLLEKLEEPGDFGIYYQAVEGKKVSRDLLDTIQELYFLDRHLGIFDRPELSILDIGAGYGRLGAHLANAYEGRLDYACTDAVALSSFLCEYYLRVRNVDGRVRMLPLDEVTEDPMRPDLAVNVHSFPECRVEAIGWWMDRLKDKGVPYLFVVPNPIDTAGKVLKNGAGEDFRSVIEERGYRLQACEPKYSDPAMQEHGLSPTHYYLFHREIDS